MAVDAHKNFAYSAVATAPSPATSGTSLVVTAGHGARFPAVSFNAVIWPAGAIPTVDNAEIVRVTAISTDTFTITRTQEGTSARTVIVGDQIAAAITAKTLTDAEENILTETAWDAKGDLIVGTGANTAAKLVVGADGNVLIALNSEVTGVKWVTSSASDPVTQALGDLPSVNSASNGIAPLLHKHGMPAAATQAEMEAASSTTVVVTPGIVHFHPGVAKVWVQGTPNSTTIITSYNVTSLGDTATGQQTVTIATDLSSANYCAQVTVGDTSTTLAKSGTVMTKAAGSYIMNSVVEAGSGSDPASDWNSVVFGDI